MSNLIGIAVNDPSNIPKYEPLSSDNSQKDIPKELKNKIFIQDFMAWAKMNSSS